MPSCSAFVVPRMDEQVKEQLKKHGKDACYGVEKFLFKLQGNILDTTGPLTGLWAAMLQGETPSPKEVLLTMQ